MSIASEITRINDAKEALKTSINNKLGSQTLITDEKIDEYSSFVDNIEVGSTEPTYFGITTSTNAPEDFAQSLNIASYVLEIPTLDTSELVDASNFGTNVPYIETIPLLDFSKVQKLNNIFDYCSDLKNLGGFNGLGTAYTDDLEDVIGLDLSYSTVLTIESACNVLNHLADVTHLEIRANPQIVFNSKLQTKFISNEQYQTAVQYATGLGWSVTYKTHASV